MMLIAGTIPIKDLPLTMAKVRAEEEFLIADGHHIPCTQGTGAMISAALTTTDYLNLEAPQVLVAGENLANPYLTKSQSPNRSPRKTHRPLLGRKCQIAFPRGRSIFFGAGVRSYPSRPFPAFCCPPMRPNSPATSKCRVSRVRSESGGSHS